MRQKLRKLLTKVAKEAQRPDRLESRAQGAALVRARAEGGEIAIVTHGVDCDGGAWSGVTHVMPAIPVHVERWLERFYDQAEGPQGYTIMRPREARAIQSEHRDLALEAFEEGRPHALLY